MQLRYWLITALCLSMFSLPCPSAQADVFDGNNAKAAKRRLIQKQAKCLARCQRVAHKRFYRCGKNRYTYCNIKAKTYFTACMKRCRAGWFCRGFIKTKKYCPALCWKNAKKRAPFKVYSKKHKKWFRNSRRNLLRWKKRTQFACVSICQSMNSHCLLPALFRNNIKKPKKRPVKKEKTPF